MSARERYYHLKGLIELKKTEASHLIDKAIDLENEIGLKRKTIDGLFEKYKSLMNEINNINDELLDKEYEALIKLEK